MSLIFDLQQEVLRKDCDTQNALRKAHLIANKLNLFEFDKWIQLELNGYSRCTRDEIPDYRIVSGVLKAFNPYHGWIPIQFNGDEIEKLICEQKLPQSIGELSELYFQSKDGTIQYKFSAEITNSIYSILDMPIQMQIALHISTHLLRAIDNSVKNCLLEWTMKLESEGIVGENMKFNNEEKETAKCIPQTINNYFGNVVNGDISQSQIVSGNNNTATYNARKVKNAIDEIRDTINNDTISSEDKDTAIELLEEISVKIDQNRKASIIKSAFICLKDFLLNAGACVTAALITAKIQGLF